MDLNIHEHKDITIPLIIIYYLQEHSELLHKSYAKSITSGFFVSFGALAPIQYVYALNLCASF